MKAPRVFQDLYGDLRDRKLLPLMGVLIVATIALPLLLTAEPPPPPSSEVTAVPALEAGELPTAPAVLAANPGLRDYHERLEAMHLKNPFRHVAENQPKSAKGAATEVPTASELGSDPAATSATSPTSAGSGGSSTSSVTETSTSSSTDTTVVEETGGGGGGGSPEPELVELSFRVDVEVGRAGDVKRRKNVKLLTVLPSQSNAVTLYLGASEDGKHAVFLVSEDVVTVRGDGRCLPTPADCQFLNMKKGDEMSFEYAPGGNEPDTYVLRVLNISLERNDETAETKEDRDSYSAESSLKAWLGL